MSKSTIFISKASIKSYWHAYLAVATAYAVPYFKALIASNHPKFDFYYFAWGLLAALVAPLTRALVAKYAWLSPLALRITTKIAQEQKLSAPTPVPATPAIPVSQNSNFASTFQPSVDNQVNASQSS